MSKKSEFGENNYRVCQEIKVDKDNYRIRESSTGVYFVEAIHDDHLEKGYTSMFYNSFFGQDFYFSSEEEAQEALSRLLTSPHPTLVRWLYWGVHPSWKGKSPCDIIFGENNKHDTIIFA